MGNRIFLLFFTIAALSLVFWFSASLLLAVRNRMGKSVRAAVWILMLPLAVVPLFFSFAPVRLALFTDAAGGLRTEVRTGPEREDPGEPDASVYLTAGRRKTAEGAALLFLTLWLLSASSSLAFGLSQYWETVNFLTRNSTECRDKRALAVFEEAGRKAGVRRSVSLRVMHPDLRLSPCMCGALSPAVFVGESLLSACTDSQLELVFLHELTHIRHHDGLLRLVTLLGTSFHALLPVSGRVREAVGEDTEILCDRDVLRVVGRDRLGEYCRVLYEIASRSVDGGALGGGLLAPASEAGKALLSRIRIMKAGEAESSRSAWAAPLCALALNLLLLNLVSVENPDNLRLDFVNPSLADALVTYFGLTDPRDLTEARLEEVWSLEIYRPAGENGPSSVWYCTVNESYPERSREGKAYPADPDSLRLDDLILFRDLRTLVIEGRRWDLPFDSAEQLDCAVILRN
ncbi:MAG: hypothetical protein E7576_02765 [Ruminococcaceae bacterium]|nr:hypothetical protein [Oscillospiraceae bacterium]